jgi:hypothetical protein
LPAHRARRYDVVSVRFSVSNPYDRDCTKKTEEELLHQMRCFSPGSAPYDDAVAELQRRELKQIGSEVARLKRPHPVVWWTFIVATLTLIVCAIGYWDQIVRLFRALKP